MLLWMREIMVFLLLFVMAYRNVMMSVKVCQCNNVCDISPTCSFDPRNISYIHYWALTV